MADDYPGDSEAGHLRRGRISGRAGARAETTKGLEGRARTARRDVKEAARDHGRNRCVRAGAYQRPIHHEPHDATALPARTEELREDLGDGEDCPGEPCHYV